MVRFLVLLFVVYLITAVFHEYLNSTNKRGFVEPAGISVAYLEDNSGELSINNIVNSRFTPIANKQCLNPNNRIVWYKVVVSNSTAHQVENLFLHSNKSYLSKQVQLFEQGQDLSIKSHTYDFLDAHVGESLVGSAIVHSFGLKAGGRKIFYLRNERLAHQCIDIELHEQSASQQALIDKNFYSNIIIVILLAMAAYNFMLYSFIRKKEFIYYSLYLINAGIGLSYMYGSVFHNLQLYGKIAHWLNLTAILVSVFLVLFVQSVFDTKKSFKKYDRLMNSVLVLSVMDVFIALFVDLGLSLNLLPIVFGYSFLVLSYIALKLHQSKHPLISIFSVAYSIYIVGISLVLLMFTGLIPYNEYIFHASGVAIIIEALLFSYLIHHRIGLLKKEVLSLTDTRDSLSKIAHIDELTKVFNRRAVNEYANKNFEIAKRRHQVFSVIMLDLDFFKKVNDEYGHHVGDRTLVKISEVITNALRDNDIFGRIGGEEFCILLPQTDMKDALHVAEKIRERIALTQIKVDAISFQQTVSLGVAVISVEDEAFDTLLQRADQALYEAKEKGRNRVSFK